MARTNFGYIYIYDSISCSSFKSYELRLTNIYGSRLTESATVSVGIDHQSLCFNYKLVTSIPDCEHSLLLSCIICCFRSFVIFSVHFVIHIKSWHFRFLQHFGGKFVNHCWHRSSLCKCQVHTSS